VTVAVPPSTERPPPRLPWFRVSSLWSIASVPSLRTAPPCAEVAVVWLPVSWLSWIVALAPETTAIPPPSAAVLSAIRLFVIVTVPASVSMPPPIWAAEFPEMTESMRITSP
jgi:hypothetical protein